MLQKAILVFLAINLVLLIVLLFKVTFSNPVTPKATQPVLNTVLITYNNGVFDPNSSAIKRGQMVEFRNTGQQSLQIALGQHPTHEEVAGFEETLLKSGKSYYFSIWKGGVYDYHDHLNPKAQGSLIVGD